MEKRGVDAVVNLGYARKACQLAHPSFSAAASNVCVMCTSESKKRRANVVRKMTTAKAAVMPFTVKKSMDRK